MNNKDNRDFMSRKYRSDSCPLEIWCLKLAYLNWKLHFLGKYLFEKHQISTEQLSANSVSRQTVYYLNNIVKNSI